MRWPTGAVARDSLSAIIILVVSVVGMIQTSNYPARAAQWPMWMWGLLAALSVVLLFNSLRAAKAAKPAVVEDKPKTDEDLTPAQRSSRGLRIAINIGLIVVLVVLVPILGFFTATGIYLCVHMFYLGIRPIWKIAAVTAGTLIVCYGVFEAFLGVLVPHGLIF